MRFFVDFRRLNASTISDTYPLPRMEDCIDSLGDTKVFTTLESLWLYFQVPFDEKDRDKTTFSSHIGTYRYSRIPFGLRNTQETFQVALNIILSGLLWCMCLVYIDEVIIFSSNE